MDRCEPLQEGKGTMTELLHSLSTQNEFVARHNGPNRNNQQKMLATIKAASLDALIDETVPAQIRLEQPMALAEAKSEADMLQAMQRFASQNQIKRTFIGQGYYNTFTPMLSYVTYLTILAGTPLIHLINQRFLKAAWKRYSISSRW